MRFSRRCAIQIDVYLKMFDIAVAAVVNCEDSLSAKTLFVEWRVV